MCGRINVSDHQGVQALLEWLNIPLHPEQFVKRYNIAPGAQLFSAFTQQQGFEGAFMEWGIIPAWAKPGKFSRPLINARAETVWEKPSFKNLVKNQRVIVPINGFYEWKRENNNKIPYHIQNSDHSTLALAGIYQISKDGIMQCCILTTAANQKMAEVHNRMPVILSPESQKDWLLSSDQTQLSSLMQPCSDNAIEITQISSHVNNAQNDDERCIEPATKQNDLFDP